MKNSLGLLVVFTLVITMWATSSHASSPRAIVGNWQTIDDETQKPRSLVRIYRASDGKYYGKIEEILNPDPGREDPDCDNCKGKYEHYRTGDGKVVGVIFLRGLEFNSRSNKWEKGTIFDPEKGREYRCEVWLDGSTLNVRGIHWTGLSRTQHWQKIE